jgi:hypothetical protein
MTTFIPRLFRITSGEGAEYASETAPSSPANKTVNVETLAGLLPDLRRRLAIGTSFSDAALLAGLVAIASHSSQEERWRAAAKSTLGQYLASTGRDHHHSLVTLLTLLPKP